MDLISSSLSFPFCSSSYFSFTNKSAISFFFLLNSRLAEFLSKWTVLPLVSIIYWNIYSLTWLKSLLFDLLQQLLLNKNILSLCFLRNHLSFLVRLIYFADYKIRIEGEQHVKHVGPFWKLAIFVVREVFKILWCSCYMSPKALYI